jgi:hypothetical protein
VNTMKKFENVDVVEVLRKIMLHNTRFYQTDFSYDIKTLTDAADASDDSIQSFLWMSHDSGTYCFPERNVYIENTYPHNTWLYHRNNPNIKAFRVDLYPMKDGQVRGNLFEIDYPEHVKDVRKNSVMPNKVELLFRNSNNIRIFDYEEYDQNWLSISNRYGTLCEIKYLVPNEQYLMDVIYNAKEAYFAHAEPAEIDNYIQDMVREHFHGRGYTADDMAYVVPDDIYNALKHGVPAYGLYPGNITQQITTKKDAQDFIRDNILLGIKHDDKKLLNYLVEHPSASHELFSRSELDYIYKTALSTGISDVEDISEIGIAESIVYKLGKVLDSFGIDDENEQTHEPDLENEL